MTVIFKRIINYSFLIINSTVLNAQLKWVNVDSLYQPLPASVHIYKTTDTLDGKPNIAFYLIADLKDKKLLFDADTTLNRRLTPSQFYEKNNRPIVVVNTTFFSFQTNQNLSVVIKDKRLVGYNIHSIPGRGKDTFTYRHPFGSAIGISKKRKADIAWVFTDSLRKYPFSSQWELAPLKDSSAKHDTKYYLYATSVGTHAMSPSLKKWKMKTAIGGGPVILQNAEIKITNNEELKFAGKAINDKHPRTAMGYTKDNKLIILVVQGRFNGIAEGATLIQEAKILQDLGCLEALNLDGGGSSCMLVNGKETIKPSDAIGQRAVPAVFLITRSKATK
jgi:exopolysaccharide biosynthesis protein